MLLPCSYDITEVRPEASIEAIRESEEAERALEAREDETSPFQAPRRQASPKSNPDKNIRLKKIGSLANPTTRKQATRESSTIFRKYIHIGKPVGAGGGIRTHEGLRHRVLSPRRARLHELTAHLTWLWYPRVFCGAPGGSFRSPKPLLNPRSTAQEMSLFLCRLPS